jgi:hypothetical protein
MSADPQVNRGRQKKTTSASPANPTQDNLESRLVFIVPVVIGVTLVLSAWRLVVAGAIVSGIAWAWKNHSQKNEARSVELNAVFYKLIQEHQGRLTVLDFAMEADIPGDEAQEYLDTRAREFSAQYEITENGGMVYCFSSIKSPEWKTIEAEITPVAPEPERLKAPKAKKARVTLPAPLNQSQLAARLGVHPTTVSKNKSKPEFTQWSQGKDPAGFAWTYAPGTKQFFPIEGEF